MFEEKKNRCQGTLFANELRHDMWNPLWLQFWNYGVAFNTYVLKMKVCEGIRWKVPYCKNKLNLKRKSGYLQRKDTHLSRIVQRHLALFPKIGKMVIKTFLCCFSIYEGSWVCGLCSLVRKELHLYRLFPGEWIVNDFVVQDKCTVYFPAVDRVGESLSWEVQFGVSPADDIRSEKPSTDQL